jgi:uncharacterized protein (TIGR03083 family)
MKHPTLYAVAPILVTHLFLPLHAELLTLLHSLTPAEWELPTVAAPWTVKDMTAHLLDTDMGRLNLRPHHEPLPAPDYDALVAMIDKRNAEWVQAARHIPTDLLMEFHAVTAPRMVAYLESLDPNAPAPISVAWAGEAVSLNWFDIAREYTEKWHHQMHIREAVGAPFLTEQRWLEPVLDTFLRGLPHLYQQVDAPDGTLIAIKITGDIGEGWALHAHDGEWRLYRGEAEDATAHIELSADVAWRLFTKGISVQEAQPHVQIRGDERLALHLLNLLAIMA